MLLMHTTTLSDAQVWTMLSNAQSATRRTRNAAIEAVADMWRSAKLPKCHPAWQTLNDAIEE